MASKNKEQQERHQAILSKLLKDEDNKYCVDCDTKGPRWASWNIGIFLCIRCAGIHRNLGVHISKVKSINLDSWTPEQLASVEDMGNSRARAVYEANLPDNYKRPTSSDQAMEQFIRAKYEHKRYIAKEWVPSKPRSTPSNYHDVAEEKKKKEKKSVKPVITIPGAAAGTTKAREATSSQSKPAELIQTNGTATTVATVSAPTATRPAQSADLLGDLFQSSNIPTQPAQSQKLASEDLFATFNSTEPQNNGSQASSQSQGDTSTTPDLFNTGQQKTQSTKDSIMALYGNTPANPPMSQSFNMLGSFTQSPAGMMNSDASYPGINMAYAPQQPTNPGMMGGMYAGQMMVNPQQAMMANQPMVGQQGMMGYYGVPQQQMQTPQLQQQQMYANQLQSQMANMTMNQTQFAMQPQTAQASTIGGMSKNSSQANGQTLNFDLWN